MTGTSRPVAARVANAGRRRSRRAGPARAPRGPRGAAAHHRRRRYRAAARARCDAYRLHEPRIAGVAKPATPRATTGRWSRRQGVARVRLVAMDMDSTLITIECIDEIAALRGIGDEVAAITAAAMRGDLDFRASLERRVALLAGLPVTDLARVYDERLRLSEGALHCWTCCSASARRRCSFRADLRSSPTGCNRACLDHRSQRARNCRRQPDGPLARRHRRCGREGRDVRESRRSLSRR